MRMAYGMPPAHKYWVYFIQAGRGGAVKIGVTGGRVQDTIRAIQTSNSDDIFILSAFMIDSHLRYQVERWIHEALSDHRIRGEWFKPVQRVLDYALLAKAGQGDAIIDMVMPDAAQEVLTY